MEYSFRQATEKDLNLIWGILEKAIHRRKEEGSNQWQDGYPNPSVIKNDIEKGYGYILTENNSTIAGYCAIVINDEPAYTHIKGKWLTNGDFVVCHRVAISEDYLGKGLAQQMFQYIETFTRQNSIYSIKVDTNFDNAGMLRIFEKMGYIYCGEVFFRGGSRKAFEKVLLKHTKE